MSAVLDHPSSSTFTTPTGQDFEVRAFDAPLGAEVIGLDLTRPVSLSEPDTS